MMAQKSFKVRGVKFRLSDLSLSLSIFLSRGERAPQRTRNKVRPLPHFVFLQLKCCVCESESKVSYIISVFLSTTTTIDRQELRSTEYGVGSSEFNYDLLFPERTNEQTKPGKINYRLFYLLTLNLTRHE